MIKAKNITLHYGSSQILHDVSLSAAPGEITCVMGNNGADKTSLMKVLAGRHPRSGGELRLMGERLGRVTAQQMARRDWLRSARQGHLPDADRAREP